MTLDITDRVGVHGCWTPVSVWKPYDYPWRTVCIIALAVVGCDGGNRGALEADDCLPRWQLSESRQVTAITPPLADVLTAFVNDTLIVQVEKYSLRIFVSPREGGKARVLGGVGMGPGEFQSVAAIGVTDEGHIWAADKELARMTVFDHLGNPQTLRLFDLPWFTTQVDWLPVGPVAIDPDGRMLFETWGIPMLQGAGESSLRPMVVTHEETLALDTVAWVEERAAPVIRSSDRITQVQSLFPTRSPYGLSPDRSSVVTVRSDREANEPVYNAHVEVFGLSGEVKLRTTYPFAAIPVDISHVEEMAAARHPGLWEVMRDLVVTRQAGWDAFIPSHYPPVYQAALSDSGEVWLAEATTNLDSLRWLILDDEGTPIASTVTEGLATVVAIMGEDLFLLVEERDGGTALKSLRITGKSSSGPC